jgi:hypothetical protein
MWSFFICKNVRMHEKFVSSFFICKDVRIHQEISLAKKKVFLNHTRDKKKKR